MKNLCLSYAKRYAISISADGVTFPLLSNFVEFSLTFRITAAAGRLILLSSIEEILLSEKFSAISPNMIRKQKTRIFKAQCCCLRKFFKEPYGAVFLVVQYNLQIS